MANYTKLNEINKKLYFKRIEKYNLNPKLCKMCKNPISYNNKENIFCGHSCAAKFNNLGVIRNKTEHRKCISCGNLLYKSKENKCLKCITEFKILNGISVGKGTLRNYVIKIRGHQCEQCKNTHWQGELIPLDAHHIDGDRKNNNLNNLKLLCKNCHGLTPNYGYKKECIKVP